MYLHLLRTAIRILSLRIERLFTALLQLQTTNSKIKPIYNRVVCNRYRQKLLCWTMNVKGCSILLGKGVGQS